MVLFPENQNESQGKLSSYRWLEDDNFDGDNDDGEQGDGNHGDKHAHVVQENLGDLELGGGGRELSSRVVLKEKKKGRKVRGQNKNEEEEHVM